MKVTYYLFFAILFVVACKNESQDPDLQPKLLENVFNITINGQEEIISFDCLNAPSLYSLGVRTDQTTSKYIFDQGFTEVQLSNNRTLSYQFIIYTEDDIRSLDIGQLIQLIESNPEIVDLEITLKEDEKIYKNLFYNLDGLSPQYEERNVVAENETIDLSLGDVNAFDCMDNIETVELKAEYSGIIKTESGADETTISLALQVHLNNWR